MTDGRVITELNTNSANYSKIAEDVECLEKKIFPEHGSSSMSIDDKLGKENVGLIYAYVHDEVAGFAMYSCQSSLSAFILELAVKEKYRRQGYGEARLKAAILKCRSRNIQRISLHVDPSRTSAVKLYKKLDFKIDSLVKNYYSGNRDAYRMYLELSTGD